MDTRWRTRHVLRPTQELVEGLLAAPSEEVWQKFRRSYRELIAARFIEDRHPFDQLAAVARENDVYLGCSCPTQKNPDVRHCHTYLALQFMEEQYPELQVVYPEAGERRS